MIQYLTAGLLAACPTAPAMAANSRLIAKSPDQPVHRRTIVLCVAVLVGLNAYQRRLALTRPKHRARYERVRTYLSVGTLYNGKYTPL